MYALQHIKFDLRDGGWATLPPGTTFGPRNCNHYQWLWIQEGHCESELDGVAYDLPPGTLVFIRHGMRDFYRWDPRRKTRAAYMHFQMSHRRAGLPPEHEWPVTRRLPENDILRPLFRHMMALLASPDPQVQAPLRTAALHFLVTFLNGNTKTHFESADDLPEAVARALRHVQVVWGKGQVRDITLADLASAGHVSRGHLCRLFQEAFGCGPMQALRLMRVDRASELLARSNLQIQEIALLTGFENPFHFSRCFRESFGIAPRAYRVQALKGEVTPHTRLLSVRRLTASWPLA